MATAERPPAKIDGKPNPAYQKWYRAQKAAEKMAVLGEAMKADRDFKPDLNTLVPIIMPPEPLTLRVVKLARNPRWVYCDLNGVKVPVQVKRGCGRKLLKKQIKVATNADGTRSHVR